MRLKQALVATLFVTLVAGVANAKNLVKEFRGSATTVTTDFVVEGPWLLDWRLDGDYDQMVALDIMLIEARTGRHVGRVLHTKRKGNGLKLFNNGGVYRLRVSSTLARWRIRIEQLTEDEAEQYTPRKPITRPFDAR